MSRKLPGSAIVPGTITVTQITGGLNDTTNASYAQANTARTTANDAYGQANAARSDANTTFATINTTFGTVNTSLGTINTNYQAAYSQANTARDTGNNAYASANLAYTQANNARSDANTTFATVNTTFGTINTNYQAAYAQANTARDTANNAYNNSNTKLSTSGGSISGDLAITGNLTVQGNATTINVTNLSVNDSMILLSTNAVGDSNDIGFIGHFDRGATATHAGLIRKATENRFYLFDNYEVEPTNNVIDVAGNNFTVGNLRLGIINANSYVTSAGLDVTGQANAAYGQANSAYGAANNRVLKAGDTMTGQLNISSGGLLVTDNVGIGITNPSNKLTIVGKFESRGLAADPNYAAFLSGIYDSAHALQLGVKINSGTESEVLGVYADGGGANPRTILNPTNGWNVGIGTTTPDSRLVVYGSPSNENSAYGQLTLTDSTTFNSSPRSGVLFRISHTSGGFAYIASVFAGKDNVTDGDTSGYLAFATRLTGSTTIERMRLTPTGNLALGTSVAAGERLRIKASNVSSSGLVQYLNVTNEADCDIVFQVTGTNASDKRVYIGPSTSTNLTFGTGNTERMRLDSSGRFGLGPNGTAPKQLMHLFGTFGEPATSGETQNGILRVAAYNGGGSAGWGETLDIGMHVGLTGPASYAWLQATNFGNHAINYNIAINPNGGNVGIGTASPSQKFHVHGSNPIRITGPSAGTSGIISVIGNLEFYKDSTPSKAYAIGMSVVGGSISDDMILTAYDGSWTERARFSNNGSFALKGAAGTYSLDTTFTAASYADGASVDFPSMSGMIIANDQLSTGYVTIWLMGGGNTTAAASVGGTVGSMAYNGSVAGYRWTNNSGQTRSVAFAVFRTRNTA